MFDLRLLNTRDRCPVRQDESSFTDQSRLVFCRYDPCEVLDIVLCNLQLYLLSIYVPGLQHSEFPH